MTKPKPVTVPFEVDFELAILAHAIRGGLEAVLAELFTFLQLPDQKKSTMPFTKRRSMPSDDWDAGSRPAKCLGARTSQPSYAAGLRAQCSQCGEVGRPPRRCANMDTPTWSRREKP